MQRKLLMPLIAVSQLFTFSSVHAESPMGSDQAVEASSAQVLSLGGKIKNKMGNALSELKYSAAIKFLDSEIGSGIYIDGKYQAESKSSVNGQYSRVDAFNIGGQVLFKELLGRDIPLNPALSVSRELMFVRQFKNRNDSVFTMPMALSKIPKNSEKALALEEGTFVSFRAPMGFAMGHDATNEFGKLGNGRIETRIVGSMFALGEFDIHVFRMTENRVRVKLFALNQAGAGVEGKLSLFDLVPGVSGFIARYLDFDIMRLGWKHTDTKLFLTDYVFNLNNEESRKLYDSVMGQKYTITDFPLGSVTPWLSQSTLKNRLYANLAEVDQVAKDDLSLELNKRRVVRVIKGENITKTNETNFRFNVKFIKIGGNSSWSNGVLQTYNLDNTVLDTYKTKGFSRSIEQSYDLFWLHGAEEKITHTSNLILKSDVHMNSTGLMGFYWTHKYQDTSLNKSDFTKVVSQLEQVIPTSAKTKFKIPKWDVKNNKNAFIEREMFVDKKALKYLESASEERIKDLLNQILATSPKLISYPYGIVNLTVTEGMPYTEADRINAYNKREYAKAFSWDVIYMTQFLQQLANSSLSIAEREKAYESLSQHTPVFHEIGPLLLLKLIPEASIDETIMLRVRMSAHGQPAYDECYPNEKICGQTDILREISAQNILITEKSFNLRNYMNEKAEIYTLPEVVIQK